MFDNFFIFIIKILPKSLLSKLFGFLANKKISRFFIKPFIKIYKVKIEESAEQKFETFNKFFTRKLKDNIRPIKNKNDVNTIISPVDGTISQYGRIKKTELIQVKNKNYSLKDLLADSQKTELFFDGYYITIYLAPYDYHRIHCPIKGQLYASSYLPGHLFPVNKLSVQKINNLFCVNERITSFLNNEKNHIAVVKVGATIVGKIKLTYDTIESNKKKKILNTSYENIEFAKGQEIGLFELGSTVILLFNKEANLKFSSFKENKKIKLGEQIATWNL